MVEAVLTGFLEIGADGVELGNDLGVADVGGDGFDSAVVIA